MTTSNRMHAFPCLLVTLITSLFLGAPRGLEAQQILYGDLYHVKNSYAGGSYLDSCGHAKCTAGTRYGVVTHSQPDRDGVGTGKWKITSATGRDHGLPVRIGDVIHLKNEYGGGSYLDSCGHAKCTAGTRYGVVTHSQPDRDGVGTGKWKVISATGKTDGQPLVANEEVYLQNLYGGGTYLDSCGHAECTAGTRYGVVTHSQPDRDGVGTGKWTFQTMDGVRIQPVGDTRCLGPITGGFDLKPCDSTTRASFQDGGEIAFGNVCVSVPISTQGNDPWRSGTRLKKTDCAAPEATEIRWRLDSQLIRANSRPDKCISIEASTGARRAVIKDCGDFGVTEWVKD